MQCILDLWQWATVPAREDAGLSRVDRRGEYGKDELWITTQFYMGWKKKKSLQGTKQNFPKTTHKAFGLQHQITLFCHFHLRNLKRIKFEDIVLQNRTLPLWGNIFKLFTCTMHIFSPHSCVCFVLHEADLYGWSGPLHQAQVMGPTSVPSPSLFSDAAQAKVNMVSKSWSRFFLLLQAKRTSVWVTHCPSDWSEAWPHRSLVHASYLLLTPGSFFIAAVWEAPQNHSVSMLNTIHARRVDTSEGY